MEAFGRVPEQHQDQKRTGAKPPNPVNSQTVCRAVRSDTPPEGNARIGLGRALRLRDRIRLSQTIAAQRARIEATGGKPSEDEAARMVSEFHARGGQVTICPPPEEGVTEGEPSHDKRR